MSEREAAIAALAAWDRYDEYGASTAKIVRQANDLAEALRSLLALSAAPSPVDGGEGSSNANSAAQGTTALLPQAQSLLDRAEAAEAALAEMQLFRNPEEDPVAYHNLMMRHSAECGPISHEDACRLGRVFCATSDLRTSQDIRINDWLKALIIRAKDASPLPLPEPGEGNAAVADSAATRGPTRAATNPLQVEKED